MPEPRRFKRFTLDEVSAVDRPAQAHARALIMKRAPIQKDMYGVSRFAEVLGSIFYLVQNAESEAQYEGDNSPVPKALREWLKAGTAVFRSMAKEEVDELIASYKKRAPDEDPDEDALEYLASFEKRSFSAGERKADAKSGAAEKDGSFPIENAKDLKNAMRAVGRSKNPGKTRAHIRARAKALGLSGELSASFKRNAAADICEEFDELLTGASSDEILKLGDALEQEDDNMDPEVKKAIDDGIAAATAPLNKALADAKRENSILKMAPAHKAYFDSLEGAVADSFVAGDEGLRAAIVEKAAKATRMDPAIEKRLAEADEDRKILKSLQEKDAVATFEKRAEGLGLAAVHGEILRKAYAGDAAAQGELDKLMKGLTEQARTGKTFAEFGSALGKGIDGPQAEVDAVVSEFMKANPKLSKQQAFTKGFYTNPAHADLKKRYDADQANQTAKRMAATGVAA